MNVIFNPLLFAGFRRHETNFQFVHSPVGFFIDAFRKDGARVIPFRSPENKSKK